MNSAMRRASSETVRTPGAVVTIGLGVMAIFLLAGSIAPA
jgi:hypothetical protein